MPPLLEYASPRGDPSIFRDLDHLVIVLKPRLGWAFALKSLAMLIAAGTLLYLATTPMREKGFILWVTRGSLITAGCGLVGLMLAQWHNGRQPTVLRVMRDRLRRERSGLLGVSTREYSLAGVTDVLLRGDGERIRLVLARRDGTETVLLRSWYRWPVETLEDAAQAINEAVRANGVTSA